MDQTNDEFQQLIDEENKQEIEGLVFMAFAGGILRNPLDENRFKVNLLLQLHDQLLINMNPEKRHTIMRLANHFKKEINKSYEEDL